MGVKWLLEDRNLLVVNEFWKGLSSCKRFYEKSRMKLDILVNILKSMSLIVILLVYADNILLAENNKEKISWNLVGN